MAVRVSDEKAMRRCAIMVMVTGLVVIVTLSGRSFGSARGGPDFDGDGFEDLVVNVPFEDLGGQANAGVVHVIYGSGSGPSADGDQLWHQDVSGVNDSIGEAEYFGVAFAWGDFDADGFDDLAIGVPGEDVSGQINAGGVAVLYGSNSGLRSNGDQFFTQDSSGMNDSAEEGDIFGVSVAAGDYDGDGFDDLAIGVTGEQIGGETAAGVVQVVYGGSNGLSSAGDQVFSQESDGVPDDAEAGDRFGWPLAAGNFDGDGRDDVAVGVVGEDLPANIENAGVVEVLYGTNGGLSGSGAQLLRRGDFGGFEDIGDEFGSALASGDFNGNGKDDLAIGSPRVYVGTVEGAGEVDVVYGSSSGLNLDNTERWALDGGAGIKDLPGTGETGDGCGTAVMGGDFDGDGRDDVAIGVPRREIGGVADAGEVIVVYGGSNGLKESTVKALHQDTSGMNESANVEDYFGYGLTSGDYDGDGRDDVGVGVPGEGVVGVARAGAAHVIFGYSGGLKSAGDKVMHQDSPGIRESAQQNDFMGVMHGPLD